MKTFENLVGARLINLNNTGFSVDTPHHGIRHFVFEEDEGDCCGFNEITTNLLVGKKEMPVITKVTTEPDDVIEGDSIKIVLFGINKPIATITSLSSSGSGWEYGATVTVKCKETGEEEVMTSY